MFIEAIKAEQKRIQRFIDLSHMGGANRGSLYVQKQGDFFYGFERRQGKGEPERKVYLGLLDSEPVRELFSIRFKEDRMARLQHNQKLLEKLERHMTLTAL